VDLTCSYAVILLKYETRITELFYFNTCSVHNETDHSDRHTHSLRLSTYRASTTVASKYGLCILAPHRLTSWQL